MNKIFTSIILILIICIICAILYKYIHYTQYTQYKQYNTFDNFGDICYTNGLMDSISSVNNDYPTYSKNEYTQTVNLGSFNNFSKYDSTGFINNDVSQIDSTKFLAQNLKFLGIITSLNDYCRNINNTNNDANAANFNASFGIKININQASTTDPFELSFIDFDSPPILLNNKILYIYYVNGAVTIKSDLFNINQQTTQISGNLQNIHIQSNIYRKQNILSIKCNIQLVHSRTDNICFQLDNIIDTGTPNSINLFNNYYLNKLKYMLIYYNKPYRIDVGIKYMPILKNTLNISTFDTNFTALYNTNFNIIKNNYISLFNKDVFNNNLQTNRLAPLFYTSYQTGKNNYEQNVIKERDANTLNETVNNILSTFNQLNTNTKIDSFTDINKKLSVEERFSNNINNLKKLKNIKNSIEQFNDVALVPQLFPPALLSTKSQSNDNLFNKIIINNQYDPTNRIIEINNLQKEFGKQSNDVYNILTAISRLPTNQQITTDKTKI